MAERENHFWKNSIRTLFKSENFHDADTDFILSFPLNIFFSRFIFFSTLYTKIFTFKDKQATFKILIF